MTHYLTISYLAQVVKLGYFYMVYNKWEYVDSNLKNCPPSDAQPASGTVYYLVKHNPPIATDFQPKAIRHPESVKSVPLGNDPDTWYCEVHGISVFTDQREALDIKKEFNFFRNWKLAVANLTSFCGYIKKTPRGDKQSHCTLWVFKDIKIWDIFKTF